MKATQRVTWRDFEALEHLRDNGTRRLSIVRTRAEKWIGGLTAASSILAAAMVVKGPDSVDDLADLPTVAVAALTGAAVVLLGFAVFNAYSAAFGSPDELRSLDTSSIRGLSNRLERATEQLAAIALRQLSTAVRLSFSALVVLVAAVGVAWLGPRSAVEPDPSCLMLSDETLGQFTAMDLTIVELGEGVSLGPCPVKSASDE